MNAEDGKAADVEEPQGAAQAGQHGAQTVGPGPEWAAVHLGLRGSPATHGCSNKDFRGCPQFLGENSTSYSHVPSHVTQPRQLSLVI